MTMGTIVVNAKCRNCEFYNDGCVPEGKPDPDAWCPGWQPMIIDPDGGEKDGDERPYESANPSLWQ